MTVLDEPAIEWPPGVLFRAPRKIPYQIDYTAQMAAMGCAMLAADLGTGKCQPVAEPVLTPDGWRPIGEIEPGDEVMGQNGQPTQVLSVHPQADRRVYRVEMNDGSWTLAGPDHLWSVQDNNDIQRRPGQWQVLSTREILDRGIAWGGATRTLRWRIPMTAPVQYREVDYGPRGLPVDPYVLGAWIGDGSSWHGGFTSADEEIIEQIRSAGHEVAKQATARRPYGWYIKDLMVDLRDMGLLRNKHIPERYLRASQDARLALLQGLLDTDGYADPRQAGIEFCTTLTALRDGITDLVRGLGGVARTGKIKKTGSKDAYRVWIKLPPQMEPFRLQRKLHAWRPPSKYPPARRIRSIVQVGDQDCVCIRVAADDGLYLTRDHIVTHNTVMSLGTAGLCLEFGLIDGVLVVCERNKLTEWEQDFGIFTRIEAALYHGPRRKKLLDALPTAVITTYETCRDDIAVFPLKKSRSRTLTPGPLFEALRGRRLLVIYDEITKLGRRSSNLYKAHYWMLAQWRKADPGLRVIGLSATPMDTDFDNIFSEMRLIAPKAMPTVKLYEDTVVKSRDPWGRPNYRQEGKEWLRSLVEPWILRKRKSDPDVREYFPPLTERFVRIRMHADQFGLYQRLEDLAWTEEGLHRDVPGLAPLLRQLAGDPWAVLEAGRAGGSELAAMVAEELEGELQKCSSAKAEELISLADLVMSGGSKLLAFTFFGQSVLPSLARRLDGRPVFTYHGGQTIRQQHEQKELFRAHRGGAILLASDAGARGINLPEVSYVVEFEVARTHALRMQRAGRGHRLGKTDPLTLISFVLDSSIEGQRAVRKLMERNTDQDFILGDEGAEEHVSAEDRRALYAQARPRKAGAAP